MKGQLYRRFAPVSAGVATADHLTYTTQPGLSGASPYTLSPQPVVAAKKADGSTDTTFVGSVLITLNVVTGSPMLTGTTTKALSSGVATFTDLVVTGAGTWTLTVTLAGLASAVSSTGTTTGGGFAGQFQELFSTTPLSGNANWVLSGSGTNGGYVDSPSGELRVGTTGSFGTVNVQAKMATAFNLGAVATHDVVWEWTSATNPINGMAEAWIVDNSGNGFGIQTFDGTQYSLQSVTIAANVASIGVAFLSIASVNSPVTTVKAPLWLRFSQNGTNYLIEYSTTGTSGWTSFISATLVSANSPVTSAMKLLFIGHGNGANGTAAENRFDSVTWT